jgi:dimethylargininase
MNPASVRFAVVRPVPDTYDRCVRTNVEEIDVELARVQHREYCNALQRLGLRLIWVEGDDTLPDSCFVEDTAVLIDRSLSDFVSHVLTVLGSCLEVGVE